MEYHLDKSQRVQNSAARAGVWLSLQNPNHSSPRTTALVTYPTTYCIQALPTCIQTFERTSPAVHNCCRTVAELLLLQPYTPRGNLRTTTSRNKRILHAVPQACNSLPADIRNASISVDFLKSKLKTHLYRQTFHK